VCAVFFPALILALFAQMKIISGVESLEIKVRNVGGGGR
jgi:hypothetical protein